MVHIALFTTQDWIRILAGLISAIPFFWTFKFYRQVPIKEYSIMTAFWFLQTLGPLSTPFLRQLPGVFPWQFRTSVTLWILYFVFLHATQILWTSKNKIIHRLQKGVLGYTLFLELMIIFWVPFNFDGSSTELFIFNQVNPTFQGEGGALLIFDTVIYGTGQQILQELFAVITMSVLLYTYFSTKPFHVTKRLRIAYRLWRVVVTLLFAYTLYTSLLWRFISVPGILLNVMAVSSLLGLAVISTFFPEGYLVSKTQVNSVFALYGYQDNNDINLKSKMPEDLDIDDIKNYLRSIPPNLGRDDETPEE